MYTFLYKVLVGYVVGLIQIADCKVLVGYVVGLIQIAEYDG